MVLENQTLTTGDVAKYCGVHYRTVIRWIEQGELNAYKLPGARGDNRVLLKDFIQFLKKNGIPIPSKLNGQQKVLVVDDDKNTARSIQRILRSKGYETEIALNGFEAGIKLGTFQPDLVTLDLKMPGVDGFEVLKFICSQFEFLPEFKILVISGLSKADFKKALKNGADDFLKKPFDKKDLLEKTKDLLGE